MCELENTASPAQVTSPPEKPKKKPERWTNERVDRLLKDQERDKKIRRVGDVKDSKTRIEWECLVHRDHPNWLNSPGNVAGSRMQGCFYCSSGALWTNERVDNALRDQKRGKEIRRVGDVENKKTPIEWECLVHKDHPNWFAPAERVVGQQKSGCPVCGQAKRIKSKTKWDNERADRLIEEQARPLYRIGDVTGVKAKVLWGCKIEACGHKWLATPDKVLRAGRGCPKCADAYRGECLAKWDNEYTDLIIQEQRREKELRRVGDVVNSQTPVEFECLAGLDHPNWLATPASVFTGQKSGCEKCGKLRAAKYLKTWTNERVDNALREQGRDKKIRRVGDVKDGRTPIEWECLVHEDHHNWFAIPVDVCGSRGSGCKECGYLKTAETQRIWTNDYVDTLLKDKKRDEEICRVGDVKDSVTPIEWECLVHEDHPNWWATPIGVAGNRQSGCPRCSGGSISKVSESFLDCLGILQDDREVKLTEIKSEHNRSPRVDGMRPDPTGQHKAIVIEFHGDYWHGNPVKRDPGEELPEFLRGTKGGCQTFGDLYQATLERDRLIESAGYRVDVVWESEWDDFKRTIKAAHKRVSGFFEDPQKPTDAELEAYFEAKNRRG